MLKDKYIVEELPITVEFLKEKRLIEGRGELVLLADGEEIRHITYFSLQPGKGFYRGGHYHKKKKEKFYVLSGSARILLEDIETREYKVLDVDAGKRVTIMPMCAHKFYALTSVQIIEYYSSAYDLNDDIRYPKFSGDLKC